MKKVNKKVIVPAVLLVVLFLLAVFLINSRSSQIKKEALQEESFKEIEILETPDTNSASEGVEEEEAKINYVKENNVKE